MRQEVEIEGQTIGPGHPLYIVAECGVTCNYDIDITKELIDVVKSSGANAIKLIFWFPDEVFSDRYMTYTYQTVRGETTENMYEMLDKLRFSLDEWREVKAHADKQGVTLFSTVNSPSGIEFAETLGLAAYKMSSWDYNHPRLWREIAARNKPMIIDTGPVDTLDLAKVMHIMKDAGNDQCVLVHCPHADVSQEMNMMSIPYMADAFGAPTGYSAEGRESDYDIMAVAMGASFLEKRLTLDRNLPGHHHVLSMEPSEFEGYVAHMRTLESALGERDLIPSRKDLEIRPTGFRRVVANQAIPAGTVITASMLEGKRPETGGVSPEFLDLMVGRTARRDLKYNEPIGWDDI